MTDDPSAVAAVGEAFKQVGNVNRAQVSLRAGVVAAIPVAGMLALGTALGSPVDAVLMGVGAMLSGVAWRSGDAPLVPPIGTMLGAAFAIAIATLAGTLTGRWPWLHLCALVVVCLAAGALTVLGRRGNVVGTQMVIAFVVFGRFPEHLHSALTLAGLVLAGGLAQTLFAWLVVYPLAWRRQLDAVAVAYRQLALMATPGLAGSQAAAAALEQADAVLSAPALFAHPRRLALSELVDEGRRIRLELIVLSSALELGQRRLHAADRPPAVTATGSDAVAHSGSELGSELDEVLRWLRDSLTLVARVAQGDADAPGELAGFADRLDRWAGGRRRVGDERVESRVAALLGQANAALRLAVELGPDPHVEAGAALQAGARDVLSPGRSGRVSRSLRRRVLSDLRRMRESATLQSAAGRHGVRLAVVVAATELLVQRTALPRGYWAVLAAATVLRPEFGATFTRGGERVLGTCAGVVIASLIAVGIDPSGWGIVVVVAALSCLTYAVFAASFTAGIAGLTAVIVFLLHGIAPDSVQTALYRGIDTIIGGGIGLLAYALWPTWSSVSMPRLLAAVVDAQRSYLDVVARSLISGRPLEDQVVRTLARSSRVAWTDAQAAIELARSEPRRGSLDPRRAATTLGALRRVVWGVHGLRLRAAEWEARPALPGLATLEPQLDRALVQLSDTLRTPGVPSDPLPALRTGYGQVDWPAAAEGELDGIRSSLDELVDAIDTAAVSVGIEVP